MSDFVHCNKCGTRPNKKPAPKFFITTCYHLLCEKCRGDGQPGTPCKHCNKPMKTMEINRGLDKRLQQMFAIPKALVEQRITALRKKQDFQLAMFISLTRMYKKQRAKLQQASQSLQKQAVMMKGKDKELEETKEMMKTLEQKISLVETERDNVQKQIDELQKMENEASPGPFDTPLHDMFTSSQQGADAENVTIFNLSQAFGDQEGFQAHNTSLNNSRGSDSMNLLNSPSMSNNTSYSEMTTPKILGLARGKSTSSPSVFSPRATNEENPYMNMFNRTSTRNAATQPTCRTPGPFNMATPSHPASRSSSGQNALNISGSAFSPNAGPGLVSLSGIIPKKNTPSSSLMEF